MSITDDLNIIKENYKQAEIAIYYQKIFARLYAQFKKLDAEIEEISTTQKFNAIPISIRQALHQNWQEVKAYIETVESNSEIMELLSYGE